MAGHFDILCAHLMFGPESGKDSWKDLAFVFELVNGDQEQQGLTSFFIYIFEKEGCMISLLQIHSLLHIQWGGC